MDYSGIAYGPVDRVGDNWIDRSRKLFAYITTNEKFNLILTICNSIASANGIRLENDNEL